MHDPLTFHEKFTPDDFEAQYNLRLSRPDYETTVIPDWKSRSEAAIAAMSCTLDIRYGGGEKQKLDVYSCGDPGAPTLIYIHGGYWQRGDKSLYGFLAQTFTDAGVNVAIIGYDLCPAVTITRIAEEIREGIAWVWHHADGLKLDRDRLNVMGHSAGGHLTQMMTGTDWPAHDPALPRDLIKSGIPISPLSLLEPVRLTQGLNAAIRMDAAEAAAQSPMLNHPPLTDAPQIVVVGGAETDEFHRQARMYAEKFTTPTRSIDLYIVPRADHFDEINILADSSSDIFDRALELIRT